MSRSFFLILAFTFVWSSFGQQYAGEPFNYTLPAAEGSEITFFNIKDANGQNTTLVNYFTLPTATKERPDPTKIQRLVIGIAGSNRNPWDYFRITELSLIGSGQVNPNITHETAAILAPWFANTADLPNGNGSTLVWSDTGWAGGDTNVFPADQKTVSTFDVLDQILQHYDDKTIYPNIRHMVIGGHSRGAQMAHRYAIIGKELNLKTPVSYWIGNPNSFLWLNSSRPIAPASNCEIYDNWREGLTNYTNAYEEAFAQNRTDVKERYDSRWVGLARGLNDHGSVNDDCKPDSQGVDRGERFYNFIKFFPPTSKMTVDYNAGVGHDSLTMMTNEPGHYRLFFDNWDGAGHVHADFGERQVPGDNPHPVST